MEKRTIVCDRCKVETEVNPKVHVNKVTHVRGKTQEIDGRFGTTATHDLCNKCSDEYLNFFLTGKEVKAVKSPTTPKAEEEKAPE